MATRTKKFISKKVTGRRKKFFIGIGVSAFILFGLFVPATAMQFENHNSFCASCHTEGEQTFFDRSLASDPIDLASIHNIKEQARCIMSADIIPSLPCLKSLTRMRIASSATPISSKNGTSTITSMSSSRNGRPWTKMLQHA